MSTPPVLLSDRAEAMRAREVQWKQLQADHEAETRRMDAALCADILEKMTPEQRRVHDYYTEKNLLMTRHAKNRSEFSRGFFPCVMVPDPQRPWIERDFRQVAMHNAERPREEQLERLADKYGVDLRREPPDEFRDIRGPVTGGSSFRFAGTGG